MSNSFRGFVEIEVGGKKRPLKFSYNTFADISDRHGTPLSVAMNLDSDTMTASQLRTLIWSGLVHGAKESGVKVDFSIEEAGEWIGHLMRDRPEGLTEIFAAFAKAMNGGEEVKAQTDGEKKAESGQN